jgi:prevent-host-death family protein
MASAGIADLKAKLSRYLQQVKAGKEVVITERGLPIAKLVPLAGTLGARRERLAKAGLLRLGTGRLAEALGAPPRGSRREGKAVLTALLDEREQGR